MGVIARDDHREPSLIEKSIAKLLFALSPFVSFFPITGEDYSLEESNRNVLLQFFFCFYFCFLHSQVNTIVNRSWSRKETALFALFVVFAIIHDDSRRKPGLIKEVIARSFCIFAIAGEDHCEPVLIEQSKAKIDRHLPNIWHSARSKPRKQEIRSSWQTLYCSVFTEKEELTSCCKSSSWC